MHWFRGNLRTIARAVPWLLAGLVCSAPAEAGSIEWRVKDRFRLVDQADVSSRAKVESLLLSLDNPSQSMAEHYDQLLSTLSGKEAARLRRSNWDQERRRYAARYLYPESYTIVARVQGAQPDASCSWTVAEVEQATAPCSDPVELTIPAEGIGGRWYGRARVKAADTSGNVSQSDVVVEDRLIVAMGDSYLSGEGNPDVPADLSRLKPSERFQKVHWPATLDPRSDPVSLAQ